MNRRLTMLTRLGFVFFVTAALMVIPASAEIIGNTIFTIEAEIPNVGMANFEVPLSSGNVVGDTLTWQLDAPVELMDGGTPIATLENASVRYVGDPVVVVNFLVNTGAVGATFTVTSGALGAFSIPNAIGTSSAAITVTDNDGGGASLTGNFTGNLAYRTFYNHTGGAATGAVFSTLVPGVIGNPNTSTPSSGAYPMPAGTYTPMDQGGTTLGTVNSMSAQWQFAVGAGDSASGTSFYEIIPEPGSCLLCLLGMVGLAVVRRR